MGEARRRKLAGNTEPNPKYRKNKRIPKYEIERTANRIAVQMFGGLISRNR